MDKQSYRIELLVPDEGKIPTFEELLALIAGTLATMEMTTAEKFASEQDLFIKVLREVFTQRFGDRFKSFGGLYHPPAGLKGPRYDVGLVLDEGEEGLFPIQIELIGKPDAKTSMH